MADWIPFFLSAGLPDDVAENYAALFMEHRIRTDMLIDLDKECLREMGIQAMGDVIAILRQAKKTRSADLCSKLPVAWGEKPLIVPLVNASNSTLTVTTGSPDKRRSTPASRIIDRIIGNDPEAVPMNISTPTPFKDLKSGNVFERLGTSDASPSGSNSGSRPHSPLVIMSPELVAPKITITKSNGNRSIVTEMLDDQSEISEMEAALGQSVFKRLGGGAVVLASKLPPMQPRDALPYAGVLKADAPKTKQKQKAVPIKVSFAPESDMVSSTSTTLISDVDRKVSAKNRLGSASVSAINLGGANLGGAAIPKKTIVLGGAKSSKKVRSSPGGDGLKRINGSAVVTPGVSGGDASSSPKATIAARLGPPAKDVIRLERPTSTTMEVDQDDDDDDDDEQVTSSSTVFLSKKRKSAESPLVVKRGGMKATFGGAAVAVGGDVYSRLGNKVTRAEASSSSSAVDSTASTLIPTAKNIISLKKKVTTAAPNSTTATAATTRTTATKTIRTKGILKRLKPPPVAEEDIDEEEEEEEIVPGKKKKMSLGKTFTITRTTGAGSSAPRASKSTSDTEKAIHAFAAAVSSKIHFDEETHEETTKLITTANKQTLNKQKLKRIMPLHEGESGLSKPMKVVERTGVRLSAKSTSATNIVERTGVQLKAKSPSVTKVIERTGVRLNAKTPSATKVVERTGVHVNVKSPSGEVRKKKIIIRRGLTSDETEVAGVWSRLGN